jgi:hypothetical protein
MRFGDERFSNPYDLHGGKPAHLRQLVRLRPSGRVCDYTLPFPACW